jgi:hypothetical protein
MRRLCSGGNGVTEPAAVRSFRGTFVTSLRSYKRIFGRPQKTVDIPDARDYRDCAFEEVGMRCERSHDHLLQDYMLRSSHPSSSAALSRRVTPVIMITLAVLMWSSTTHAGLSMLYNALCQWAKNLVEIQ